MLSVTMRWILVALSACVICGCESVSASQSARLNLRLPPAALGTSISLQQHLVVERGEHTDVLDAALEIDAEHISLVGLAMGQRVLSFNYDGIAFQSWRHPLLPAQVRNEDVLEDIQLTYWPADAIREALPEGWRIEEGGLTRTLFEGDAPVEIITYSATPPWKGKVVLSNLKYRYRLTIESVVVE
jgi:hypothetical protein